MIHACTFGFTLVLCLISNRLAWGGTAMPEAAVRNGDFAILNHGFPENWTARHSETIERVAHPEIKGKYCLRIKANTAVTDALIQQKGLNLFAGVDYLLRYRIKASERQEFRVYLENSNPPGGFFTDWKVATGQWQLIQQGFRFEQLKSAPYLVIWVKAPGQMLVTDVQIVPRPPAPPMAPDQIYNGTFTEGDRGWEWEQGTAQIVSEPGEAGAGNSLKLSSSKKGFDPEACQRSIRVGSGRRYRLGYRVRAGGGSAETTGYQYFRVFTRYEAPIKNGQVYGDMQQMDGTNWQDALEHWQKRSLVFRTPNKSLGGMTLICQIRGPGTIFFDDFVLEPLAEETKISAIAIDIQKPWYRDCIFSTTPVDRIEGVVTIDNPQASKADLRFIDSAGKVLYETQIQPPALRFTIPAGNLPAGGYTVQVKLRDRKGVLLEETAKAIRKLPAQPHEVTFRPDNVLLMGGKPWFPIGIWHFVADEAALYEFTRAGVNTFIASQEKTTIDLVGRYGAKVLAIIADKLSYYGDPENRKKWTKAYVDRYGELFDHPALLGYFLTDEPLWAGRPLDELLDSYEFHRRLNPYRPVFINEAPRNTIAELARYAQACDIDGVDIYPVPENSHSELADKTVSCVGKYTQIMRRAVADRKPIWMTLQGFSWVHLSSPEDSRAVYPTQEQLRFMAYDAIIHGAKGVMFWGTHAIVRSDYWDVLFKVTGELRDLSAVLAAETVTDSSVNVSDPALHVLHKRLKGQDYLLVENTGKNPVTVRMDTGWPQRALTVLFENRNIAMAKGSFADQFKPYAVHIYATTDTLPAPLAPPPALDPCREGKQSLKNLRTANDHLPVYSGKANWIWYKGKSQQPGSVCYLQKEFTLDEPVRSAKLIASADDTYTLYINGQFIADERAGKCKGWGIAEQYDLTKSLRPGQNLIAVCAEDMGNAPCGFMADLRIVTQSGKNVVVVSDGTWKTAEWASDGWYKTPQRDGWSAAEIIGPYGGAPWGSRMKVGQP